MLTVVTTATPDYARPWIFPSLGMVRGRVVALLSPDDRRPLPVNVQCYPYQTPGVLYQDGRFLDAVPDVSGDDLVVLADADGVFQRDFSYAELETLADLTDGVALGYNVRSGQQGEEEYQRLGPRRGLEEAATALNLPASLLCGAWIYNTGFMAARARTWHRIRRQFAETFLRIQPPGSEITSGGIGASLFRLPAWPQYFLCVLLALHGCAVTELDYSVHSHGHCPLTPRHRIEKRCLWYAGERVLFAHNVHGVSH